MSQRMRPPMLSSLTRAPVKILPIWEPSGIGFEIETVGMAPAGTSPKGCFCASLYWSKLVSSPCAGQLPESQVTEESSLYGRTTRRSICKDITAILDLVRLGENLEMQFS